MPDAVTVAEKLASVKMIVLDVDGVLTDGVITYGSDGSETKSFHINDGLGIQLARHAGLIIAWITGRESSAVNRRAEELKIHHLFTGIANKSIPLAQLMATYEFTAKNIAYMGDDLNDLPALSLAGVKFAPANAVPEILAHADFVTIKSGGSGAVREMCDTILKSQDTFTDALTAYLSEVLHPQN
ncbi:MAG: HAD hydrolase family protein [Chthonomonadales bacterium]